jgi:hypothetical protein
MKLRWRSEQGKMYTRVVYKDGTIVGIVYSPNTTKLCDIVVFKNGIMKFKSIDQTIQKALSTIYGDREFIDWEK